jgi:hypothetical protein
MDLHANVQAWQREEDGSYASHVDDFKLSVKWRPEKPGERRGFLWKVEGPGGYSAEAAEVEEEIEVAMALAEHAMRHSELEPKAKHQTE